MFWARVRLRRPGLESLGYVSTGEGEVERLGVQKKLVCKTVTSAMVDLRDFVLAAEIHVCIIAVFSVSL